MNLSKQGVYRNRRLLNLAHRVQECQFKTPYCVGFQAHGCNPCHSNHQEHGKGIGIKAGDQWHCIGCNECHAAYDGGKLGDKAKELFLAARERTFAYYRKFNWLNKVGYADKKEKSCL